MFPEHFVVTNWGHICSTYSHKDPEFGENFDRNIQIFPELAFFINNFCVFIHEIIDLECPHSFIL